MMPQDMQQDDNTQDPQMIIQMLQKVINDMKSMEADRLMPDHMKPKVEMAKVDVMAPKDDMPMDDSDQSSDLDPEIMKQLMDKANHADDSGSTPDDSMNELDPEIADAVRAKKGMK